MSIDVQRTIRKVRAVSFSKRPFDDLLALRPQGIAGLARICGDCHQPEDLRISACRVLGETMSKRALPVLLQVLQEDSPNLVWAAALALENLEDREAVLPLVAIATCSVHTFSIQSAIHVLGCLGDARAAVVLSRILQDRDAPESIRVEAAEAIKMLFYCGVRLRRVVPALIRVLDDTSPMIRWSSVDALAHSEDLRAIPAVKKLLSDDATPNGLNSIRSRAMSALRLLSSAKERTRSA